MIIEPDCIFKPSAKATTLELVREEVLGKAECPQKFYGLEGKESSEDF